MDKIGKIRDLVHEEVKKSVDPAQWEFHFLPVHNWSLLLAEKFNANKEVVELAAWLHDYTRVRDGLKDHQITGAIEAKRILTEMGYSDKMTEHVHDCIRTHQVRKNEDPPATIEAKIIATADSFAHYENIPWLITVHYRKHQDAKKAIEWVLDKIENGWNQKVCIPESRPLIQETYEKACFILRKSLGKE